MRSECTPAEQEVLYRLTLTNPQISKELCIELSTVKAHLHNLFIKSHCKTRTELLLWGLKEGHILEDEVWRLLTNFKKNA